MRSARPEALLRPECRLERAGHFVAVGVRTDARQRVDAHVRVGIDDSRRDPAPRDVDRDSAGRNLQVGSHRFDARAAHDHIPAFQDRTGRPEDRATAKHRRGHIGAGLWLAWKRFAWKRNVRAAREQARRNQTAQGRAQPRHGAGL